jgi:hypothetical protein
VGRMRRSGVGLDDREPCTHVLRLPRKVRQAGISILTSLLAIIHSSDAFTNCDFPLDQCETFAADVQQVPRLITGHSCTKTALRVIPLSSAGMKAALEALFDYLLARTVAMSPGVKLTVKRPRGSISLPQN